MGVVKQKQQNKVSVGSSPYMSRAELEADEAFKAACRLMTEKRKVRDTLVKKREQRQLQEGYKAVLAENAALKDQLKRAVEYRDRLENQLRTLLTAAEKTARDHAMAADKAKLDISERDQLIRELEKKLATIQEVFGRTASQEPPAQNSGLEPPDADERVFQDEAPLDDGQQSEVVPPDHDERGFLDDDPLNDEKPMPRFRRRPCLGSDRPAAHDAA